jgi:hypothetical protein
MHKKWREKKHVEKNEGGTEKFQPVFRAVRQETGTPVKTGLIKACGAARIFPLGRLKLVRRLNRQRHVG